MPWTSDCSLGRSRESEDPSAQGEMIAPRVFPFPQLPHSCRSGVTLGLVWPTASAFTFVLCAIEWTADWVEVLRFQTD